MTLTFCSFSYLSWPRFLFLFLYGILSDSLEAEYRVRGAAGKGRWGTGEGGAHGRLLMAFGLALKDDGCREGTG